MTFPSPFLIMDSSKSLYQGDITYPFAFDEVIARKVGQAALPPIVHLWRHQQAFVLGLRDRRLPHALQAMEELEGDGYSVTVRNSGGAAVPLDPGVLNVSLILPNPRGNMEFHQDFEQMYELIQGGLRKWGVIEKGEIAGSYCPGDFDLSVAGQKFCGIAQRRQTKAFAVQAFIVVEGAGSKRAEVVRRFYETASRGDDSLVFPDVALERMASLSELMRIPSMEDCTEQFIAYLSEQGGRLAEWPELMTEAEEIGQMMVELKSRYEKR